MCLLCYSNNKNKKKFNETNGDIETEISGKRNV